MTLKVEVMHNSNLDEQLNDLELQGHAIDIEQFNYQNWILYIFLILRKHTHEQFHTKIRREVKNPGVVTTPPPPSAVNVGRNSLVLGGLTS